MIPGPENSGIITRGCPVSRDRFGNWVISGHAEVVEAALDPATFSSAASRHLNVPNGMDGREHRQFRSLVDRHLDARSILRLEPDFRKIAAGLVRPLASGEPVDAVTDIGARFAVRAQSAWLGWPPSLEDTLLDWMDDNRLATRSGDLARTREVAERFDAIVRSQVDLRRKAGAAAPDDVTTSLLGEKVDGRSLSDEEIVSILRNWTAGDLGSIALCVGVIVQRLASEIELQTEWRVGAPRQHVLDAGIDEILRIDDPFTFNKRVTTAETEIGGQAIPAGERVLLSWAEANRDPEVFADPDGFRPTRNAPQNLVYGIGPHVCPGRGLATLELRVIVSELLAATSRIEPESGHPPEREAYPYSGFRSVPVRLHPARRLTGPSASTPNHPRNQREWPGASSAQ